MPHGTGKTQISVVWRTGSRFLKISTKSSITNCTRNGLKIGLLIRVESFRKDLKD